MSNATLIASVDTSYPQIPDFRGRVVSIDGWNSDYVMLLIRSDLGTAEAIISPEQLRFLAEKAEQEAHKW